MKEVFLKVNKDLFTMGLNPTEILIIAQIIEFQTNTGDCYITDQQLAKQFGVSESTISRELKKLESNGLIVRETRNIKGGKERHLKLSSINLPIVNETTTSKLPIVQESNCLLYNKQNDFIKDNNLKDKEKDNLENQIPVEGRVSKEELAYHKCAYEPVAANIIKILATGKIVEVI